MFGTDRAITDFSLRIDAVEKGEKEYCRVWGCVSYTAELDFRSDTTPDTIVIYLGLSRERFTKLSELIASKSIDVARIGVSRGAGFYSDWSPTITTDSVKILARGKEQEIEMPEGCEIEPPRLGDVESFDLTLITRSELNPKQNLESVNILKLFEDNDEGYEEEEDPADINRLLLGQLAINQAELIKLRTPIWFVAALLGLLLITIWV